MWSTLVRFTLCAVALVLCACATFDKISLDKTKLEKIRTIALLRVGESQYIKVLNLGSAELLLGPTGGGADAFVAEQRAKQFAKSLNDRELRMGPAMASVLRDGLRSQGFEVMYLKDQSPKLAADGKTDDYSHIQTSADAILSVWFGTTGYVSPNFLTPFQPWTMVSVRLLDAKTKNVLYYQVFSAGFDLQDANVENVPGCDRPTYTSAEKLLNDIHGAYNGITVCHRAIGQRIATSLK